MGQYRKKPVVIEAIQFISGAPTSPWIADAVSAGAIHMQGGEKPYLTIKTLEGEMRAEPMDWIIRGVRGELYPCKPDIFAATYEEVK